MITLFYMLVLCTGVFFLEKRIRTKLASHLKCSLYILLRTNNNNNNNNSQNFESQIHDQLTF